MRLRIRSIWGENIEEKREESWLHRHRYICTKYGSTIENQSQWPLHRISRFCESKRNISSKRLTYYKKIFQRIRLYGTCPVKSSDGKNCLPYEASIRMIYIDEGCRKPL